MVVVALAVAHGAKSLFVTNANTNTLVSNQRLRIRIETDPFIFHDSQTHV
jgi:hypothetical protein